MNKFTQGAGLGVGSAILGGFLSVVALLQTDRTELGDDPLPQHSTKQYVTVDLIDKRYIAFHHLAAEITSDQAANYHVHDKNWPEIAYHYIIYRDGSWERTNWIDEVTYGVKGHNRMSIHIALQGDLCKTEPTPEQIATAEFLTSALATVCYIEDVYGHGERGSTECPCSFQPYVEEFKNKLLICG